jgi:hypothetical protein
MMLDLLLRWLLGDPDDGNGIHTGDPDVPDGNITGPRRWWDWI